MDEVSDVHALHAYFDHMCFSASTAGFHSKPKEGDTRRRESEKGRVYEGRRESGKDSGLEL